jgi:hypothetical protein
LLAKDIKYGGKSIFWLCILELRFNLIPKNAFEKSL